MFRTRYLVSISLTLMFVLAACGSSTSTTTSSTTPTATVQQSSGYKHIFYIMMENHATNEIIGNTADAPYINQLASQYGVAMNYYGVTHPSLPNYLAAISGDFQGIWDDCAAGASVTCAPQEFIAGASYSKTQLLTDAQKAAATAQVHMFSGQNIVDQLETAKLTWKAYMQSMPSAGFTGEYYPTTTDSTGKTVPVKLYAQKHNPFEYFSDITNNPTRMQNIVPFTSFAQDMQSSNVPNFVWISPDQCSDMHGVSPSSASFLGIPDCGYPASGLDHKVIARGDQFINSVVPQIMSSPAWKEGAAIVIAWDEDDYAGYAGCCQSPVGANNVVLGGANAPAIVITSKGAHPLSLTTQFNHYSLLATIEKLWGLPCLANACKVTDYMTPFFQF